MDTSKPKMLADNTQYVKDGEPQWQAICECFDESDAKRIAAALNKAGRRR